MNKIARCFSLLRKCLSYSYDPPNAHCEPPQSLQSAVNDCAVQGKLLILNLSINNNTKNLNLNVSNEDYIIFSSPYNSRVSFHITQNFPINSLPFVGLFYCPTKNPSEVQLLDKFDKPQDCSRINGHFRRLANDLYDRRNKYVSRELSRNIIIDQDAEYNEVLHEAQMKDKMKEEQLERQKKRDEVKQQKIKSALRRFNLLPNPPAKDDPLTYDIQFMIDKKKPKIRKFKATDKVSVLFDYVAVDFAPSQPIIKVGFPPRTLTHDDLDKSLSDLSFAKKQTVFVTSNDDEDDEEEEESVDIIKDM